MSLSPSMSQVWPLTRDLVLIGGGHAHALVLRAWGMNPQAGTRVTVVNPGPVAPYTGMLPGYIAGHYTRAEMMIDLVRLARFAGARAVLDRAIGIDRVAGHVLLQSGRTLRYDVASIDIGIASDLPDLPGFADHATAAKPLGGYADRWEAFVQSAPKVPRVTLIGAGVGGAELAMATAHCLRSAGRQPQVTVLEREATALPAVGAGARAALLAHLAAQGVHLRLGATPVAIGADSVTLDSGETLASDFTLSVAGARPQHWLTETGLDLTDGFVTVHETLQSSDPAIFAVGDTAHMAHAPRPKAGVFAVRQAPILHHNLRAALSGGAMRRYHPQRDYLKLISTGGQRAVADKLGLRLEGAWLWTWKDHIDRAFMDKFATYPTMAAVVPPRDSADGLAAALGAKPLCGGCGAKVGAGALRGALAGLPVPRNPQVLSGPGDDAAVLDLGQGRIQVLTTDHLRAFTADPALMARIAAHHALGDIWAMGARPQTALAQITLPRAGDRVQADMLSEVMTNAGKVLAAAGADIVGGHTSVGAELTIGFAVTGVIDAVDGRAGRVIAKSGALAGDALILTKPLGTGTILAAEMAMALVPGLLLGESVAAAFASMTQDLAGAAGLLAPHAHAMTDVTGFGLAGHLLEILEASGVAATLDLSAIPVLPGAEALAAAGHASSLAPANRAAVLGRVHAPDCPRTALLYDPQTAGGLLAAVPADQAAGLLAALIAGGAVAAVIGHIRKGAPVVTATD